MKHLLNFLLGMFAVCSSSIVLAAVDSCVHENTAIPYSTPVSDFIVHDDGTVTHKTTALMWKRCSEGQTWDGSTCTGSASSFTWSEALALTNSTYSSYSDWRLPNKNELFSIFEFRCYEPTINNGLFPNTTDFNALYWSSSPMLSNDDRAWVVVFSFGNTLGHASKTSIHYVRLVRDVTTDSTTSD